MRPLADDQNSSGTNADFIDTLSSFSRLHRAQRWEGTFGEFLGVILPGNAAALARTSHEYMWDMLRWHGRATQPDAGDNMRARELFKRELFGIDEALSRVVDYFKAAAAGSDVGRRAEQQQRSEEHTSELQSPDHLVCRLLLEKKKNKNNLLKTLLPLSMLGDNRY